MYVCKLVRGCVYSLQGMCVIGRLPLFACECVLSPDQPGPGLEHAW